MDVTSPHITPKRHYYIYHSYNGISQDDYIVYLKQATTHFTPQQRNVIVQMDKNHVKSEFTYKAGKVIGSSGNFNEPTRTVLALSLHKKWSTIVRLIPCSTTSAGTLFPLVKQIICDIELCNLQVKVLCTDLLSSNYSQCLKLWMLKSHILVI